MSEPWTLRRSFAPGLAALRLHWPPLVFIQAVAVVFVVSYYRAPGLQASAAVLAGWKAQGGVGFAFLAGALAGGAIPDVAKVFTGQLRRFDRAWLGNFLFNSFAYGVVGVEVNAFYGLQALLFGVGHAPTTLVVKTTFDMFVFSPLISIPCAVVMYEWRKEGWRVPEQLRRRPLEFYKDKVTPALLLCWVFWIPVLFCTYAMPIELQFCFATLAEAAWSILFVSMTKDHVVTAP